jgi:polyisoprenoid-binding protein YceI
MTDIEIRSDEIAREDLSGDYELDPAHSRLGFVARHAMVTKVRGQFRTFSGTLHIDAQEPSRSTAELTIQADSVDTGNEQRDGHLRTNDFFDIENHPTWTFRSTAAELVGEDTYRVTGDLTIRGVTKPVTVDLEYTGSARDPFGNVRVGFEGRTTVNRKDWGVNWNAPLEAGGILVSEKVTLELDLSAIKNQPTA